LENLSQEKDYNKIYIPNHEKLEFPRMARTTVKTSCLKSDREIF